MSEKTAIVEEEEEEIDGPAEWVLTFSDMMTLLLCFFVLLFSLSEVQVEKFVDLVQSLETAFGTFEVPMSGTKQNLQMPTKGKAQNNPDAKDELGKKVIKDLKVIKSRTEEFVSKSQFSGKVHVTLDGRGAAVRVSEQVVFLPGTAILSPGAGDLLAGLWEVVNGFSYRVRVEGHINEGNDYDHSYINSFDFSASRAAVVARYFVNRGFPPQRISVSGFGFYRPVTENATAVENRRIEIVFVRESMFEALIKSKTQTKAYFLD